MKLQKDDSVLKSLTRPDGWLYNQVAMRTTTEPSINVKVILKLKRMTDARKEMTMLKLVAKPLRILSEYFITIAVTKPPRTCTATVAHAHMPKLRNIAEAQPAPDLMLGAWETNTGASAGRRENNDNWTLRTQRSAWEFLRTISK